MGNPTLNKYGLFGYKVQTGHRVDPGDKGWTWVPFIDEPTFKWNPNAQVLDQADRIHFDHLIYSNVAYYTGGVSFYLMPGMLTSFVDWLQTRDSYNQGKFASVIIGAYDAALRYSICAADVKIASAEFVIEQNSPVRVNLDLVGISDGADIGITIADFSEWDASVATDANIAPYINKETRFTFDPTGSNLTQSYDIRNCTLRVDNKVQSPDEGIRFNGSENPYRLYNEGGIRCTGSFSRDYVDSDVYTAFTSQYISAAWYAASTYGALRITLTRAGVATLQLDLPRIAYNDHSSGLRGSRDGIAVESLDFTAMGKRDTSPGAGDYPITLTAS